MPPIEGIAFKFINRCRKGIAFPRRMRQSRYGNERCFNLEFANLNLRLTPSTMESARRAQPRLLKGATLAQQSEFSID